MTIKEIRKKMGLSQKDFAEKYGFSVRTLQNWEQGRRKVPLHVQILLKEICNLEQK